MKSQARYLGISLALALLLLGGGWMLLSAESSVSATVHGLPPGSIDAPLAPAVGPVLNLTLTPSDPFPSRGQTLTYTLVMSNTGDAPAAGAAMTNTLPSGLTYVSDSLQATAGDASYASTSGTVHWRGDLAVDTPVIVTYAATLNTSDYVYSTAVLHHPDAEDDAGATSGTADVWSDPAPLDAAHVFDEELGGRRHIAIDSDGVPHIAYGGRTGLHYATLSGTTWVSETVVGSPIFASNASLVLDDRDAAHIAFYGMGELWLAEQISAGDAPTWTVTGIVENAWSVGIVDLQQGSDGTLHLVYEETADEALYYTVQNGAGWADPVEVIPGDACDPEDGYALALDQDDVPYVACVYDGLPLREVRLYSYDVVAPWTTFEVVDSSGETFYRYPSLVFDGNTPHLAFFRGRKALYHAQPGGSWEVTLVDEVAGDYLRQATALDVRGGRIGVASALRAGTHGDYAMAVRYAARPMAGTAWTKEMVADLAYEAGDPRPTLALDGDGLAHVAYFYSPAEALRYAAEAEAFAAETVDISRRMRSAAVAVDGDGDVHVAWHARQLHYAFSAADATTWTRQIALPDPGMDGPELSLAVDSGKVPHLAYGDAREPLYHATLDGGAWITRQVDAPGDVEVHASIAADVTGTAHIAYVAQEGDDLAVRHGDFDGAAWATETLGVVGPDVHDHEQQPRLVAWDGAVHVLYADCTAYTEDGDFPIDLVLRTRDGGAWDETILESFMGRCDSEDLVYYLDAGEDGDLAALLTAPVVRGFSLAVSRASEEVAGRPPSVASPNAPGQVDTSMGMTVTPRFWLLGDGWISTVVQRGLRFIQHWDKAGRASEKVVVGSGRGFVTLEDGDGRSGTSVVVERWEDENELRVPRARRKPGSDEPTLTLGGGMDEEGFCPDEAAGQERTVFNVSLTVNPVTDWEALSIQFQASGSGDDVADVESVRLYQGGTLLSSGHYPADDGLISLAVGRRIPAGTTLDLRLVYVFEEDVDDCQLAVRSYAAETKVAWVNAEPVDPGAYPDYRKEPPTPVTGDPLTLACIWNVTTDEPFQLIQGAVDDGDTGDGHVINVCPGTYTENVDVTKSLTIQSTDGREVTTVQAAQGVDHVFETTEGATTIRGLTVKGAKDAWGIFAREGIALRQANVMDNGQGVFSQGGTLSAVDLLVQENVGVGVVGANDGVHLEDVEIRRNGGDGIGLIGGAHGGEPLGGLVIAGGDNRIVENGGHGVKAVVGDVTIEGSIAIHDNGGWGIHAGGRVEIRDGGMEGVERNGQGGIFGATGIVLPAGFVVEENGGPGIVVGVDGSVHLEDVKVRRNDGDGIGVIGEMEGGRARGVLVIDGPESQIVENAGHGVKAVASGVTVQGGTVIQDNGGWGIHAAGGKVEIRDGAMESVERNGQGGILGTQGVDLPRGFVVEKNGGPGIVAANADLHLEDVEVRDNDGDGIGVDTCDLVLQGRGTEIVSNGGHGVYARSSDVTLNHVDVSSNGGWGVWAIAGDGVQIVDTTVRYNDSGGVRGDRISLEADRLTLDLNHGDGLKGVFSSAAVRNSLVTHNHGYGILAVDTDLDVEGVEVAYNILGGMKSVGTGSTAGEAAGGRRGDARSEDGTSASTIASSTVISNAGDGIHVAGGLASLIVSESNLVDNAGYALINADPAADVNAQGNWWGAPGDPGDVISGGVTYSPWSHSPHALALFADADPLLVPRGVSGATPVHVQRWRHTPDTVELTATDAEGWLTGPSVVTVPLEEGVGATVPFSYLVPAVTPLGATSLVTVSGASLHDPSMTVTAALRFTAASVADLGVEQEGDPAESRVGETLTYSVTVTNRGPNDATGVILTETLPATVTLETATPSQGGCASHGSALRCDLGEIASGSRATVVAAVRTASGGAIASTVRVSSEEHDPILRDNVETVYATATVPTAPTSVSLGGPGSGAPGARHTFVARLRPATTTPPVTYTWQASGQWWLEEVRTTYDVSDELVVMWPATGTQTITVTAANACGEVVSDVHTITIDAFGGHRVYLPLLVRANQ